MNLNTVAKNWYNSYMANGRKTGRGTGITLGKKGDVIFTFPESICRTHADASAGDSGGPNPRPVGMTLSAKRVKDIGGQKAVIKKAFASPASVRALINLSRRNYGDAEIQQRLARKVQRTLAKKTQSMTVQIPKDVKEIRLVLVDSLAN
jgi:hypothetical protein